MKPLTDRQREVAILLAQGLGKKQIAFELHISKHTLTKHITNIYDRTGCRDRVNLVYWLQREGVIPIPSGSPRVDNRRRS